MRNSRIASTGMLLAMAMGASSFGATLLGAGLREPRDHRITQPKSKPKHKLAGNKLGNKAGKSHVGMASTRTRRSRSTA